MAQEARRHDGKPTRRDRTGESLAGVVWVIGWLFTMGYTKLIWWQALIGIVIWPYYLGAAVRSISVSQ